MSQDDFILLWKAMYSLFATVWRPCSPRRLVVFCGNGTALLSPKRLICCASSGAAFLAEPSCVEQGGVGESDDLQAITAFGRSLLDLAAIEHDHSIKERCACLHVVYRLLASPRMNRLSYRQNDFKMLDAVPLINRISPAGKSSCSRCPTCPQRMAPRDAQTWCTATSRKCTTSTRAQMPTSIP